MCACECVCGGSQGRETAKGGSAPAKKLREQRSSCHSSPSLAMPLDCGRTGRLRKIFGEGTTGGRGDKKNTQPISLQFPQPQRHDTATAAVGAGGKAHWGAEAKGETRRRRERGAERRRGCHVGGSGKRRRSAAVGRQPPRACPRPNTAKSAPSATPRGTAATPRGGRGCGGRCDALRRAERAARAEEGGRRGKTSARKRDKRSSGPDSEHPLLHPSPVCCGQQRVPTMHRSPAHRTARVPRGAQWRIRRAKAGKRERERDNREKGREDFGDGAEGSNRFSIFRARPAPPPFRRHRWPHRPCVRCATDTDEGSGNTAAEG